MYCRNSCPGMYCRMGQWGDTIFMCEECYDTFTAEEVEINDYEIDFAELRRRILQKPEPEAKRRIMKYLTFIGRPDAEVYDTEQIGVYYCDLLATKPRPHMYNLFQPALKRT